ncbi:MAG: hypothetical protein K2Y39_06620 [Candidatus Obscuribacterales bacterium]|nr:hypothetical protein [Candidatus Obscuribacterales bacterium]
MKNIVRAASLGLAISAFIQMALAQAEISLMSAAPFIACDSPGSPSVAASTVSTAKRSPYFSATNVSSAPRGTYSGIVITPDAAVVPNRLTSIRFDYKGSDKTTCFVDYKPPVGTWLRSSVLLSDGKTLADKHDGFKTIQLTGQQFGIAENCLIKRITIVPPPRKEAGRFLADAIYVNDSPVRKVMNTLFYKVDAGSPTGPIEFSQPKLAAGAVSGAPTGATQFLISNNTNSPQNVYITLGAGLPACAIATPDAIPWLPNKGVQPYGTSGASITWQVAGSPLQNYFVLPAKTSVVSNLGSMQMLSNINISFGAPGGCGNGSGAFPQGITQAEFSINTYCWTNDYSHNESADITLNTGNNAFLEMRFLGSNADLWLALQGTSTYKLNRGRIRNFCLNSNFNNPGVFPFGCNLCVNPVTSACVYPAAPANCNASTNNYCQLNRTACFYGGTIAVVFNGYDPTTSSSSGFAPIVSCPPVNLPTLIPAQNPACP